MANKLTPMINDLNVANVRSQIARKKGPSPYHATTQQAVQVITDYDTFPYPRYYRGVPNSSAPIVAEREAGWRPRHDNCYQVNEPPSTMPASYPNHCFQSACSTVFPCYPEYITKYADREMLDTILNRACIPQYR